MQENLKMFLNETKTKINELHRTYHINFHFGFPSNELFQSQSIGNRELTRIPGQVPVFYWVLQSDQGIKKENVVMFDKKMFGYVHCSRNLNMFVHLLRKNIENKTNMTRDFYLEFEQYLS